MGASQAIRAFTLLVVCLAVAVGGARTELIKSEGDNNSRKLLQVDIGKAASNVAKAASDLVGGIQAVAQPQQGITNAVASNIGQILQTPSASSAASTFISDTSKAAGAVAKALQGQQTPGNGMDPILAVVGSAITAGSNRDSSQISQALQTMGSLLGLATQATGNVGNGFAPLLGNILSTQSPPAPKKKGSSPSTGIGQLVSAALNAQTQGSTGIALGSLAAQVANDVLGGQTQASQASSIVSTVNMAVNQLLGMVNTTLNTVPAAAPFPSVNVTEIVANFLPSNPSPNFAQQFINRAFPIIGQSPPNTGKDTAAESKAAAEKSKAAAENKAIAEKQAAVDEQSSSAMFPPATVSTDLAPNSAEAGVMAPSVRRRGHNLAPAPAPGQHHKKAPAPAPAFAPAPAPAQNISVAFNFTMGPINITQAFQVILNQAASFSATFNISTMAGQPLSAAISQTLQYVQDLQQLASPLATAAQFGQANSDILAIFDKTCAKPNVDLPKIGKPSCYGDRMRLSLVPWSCIVDASTNMLSCTPAYLQMTKLKGGCTILDVSEGSLGGRNCGLSQEFGPSSHDKFGGQLFTLKVLDLLTSLEKAAGAPLNSPIISIAEAANSIQNLPSSIGAAFNAMVGSG